MPTEFGSPLWAGRTPRADAAAVARLRAAGAVIMGKTVTTEYAYYHPGKTRNPHDPERTPGRLLERLGRGRRRRHGAGRDRLADQRLGDPPGRLLRRGRLQADARPHPAHRRADAVARARSCRRVRAHASRTRRCWPRCWPASTRRTPTRGRWRARRSPPSRRASRRCRRASPSCESPAWEHAEPVTREAFAELVDALGEAVDRGRARRRASSRAIDLHRTVMEVDMAHNLHRDYEQGGDQLSAALRAADRARPRARRRSTTLRAVAAHRAAQRGARLTSSTNTTRSSRRPRRARRRAGWHRPATRCSARPGPISARRPSRCRCCGPKRACRSACSSSAGAATTRASCARRAGLSKLSSAPAAADKAACRLKPRAAAGKGNRHDQPDHRHHRDWRWRWPFSASWWCGCRRRR